MIKTWFSNNCTSVGVVPKKLIMQRNSTINTTGGMWLKHPGELRESLELVMILCASNTFDVMRSNYILTSVSIRSPPMGVFTFYSLTTLYHGWLNLHFWKKNLVQLKPDEIMQMNSTYKSKYRSSSTRHINTSFHSVDMSDSWDCWIF